MKILKSQKVITFKVMDETLNPTWDQTLIIPNITLFGRADELREDPPMIIVEIFDRDTVVSFELLTMVFFHKTM